jgi:hypothetical protein
VKAFLFAFLVACAGVDPEPPVAAPEPPQPKACFPDAKLSVSDAVMTRAGSAVVHLKIEGIPDGTRVTFDAAAVEPFVPPVVLPAVSATFATTTLDPAPRPRTVASSGPRGFFSAIGNLMKGAIVGLTNLVLLPVNLPLSLIDSRHPVFPFSWNAGSLSDAYPSAPAHPFFADNVLDETAFATHKASYDAKLATVTEKSAEIERRARQAESPNACSAKSQTYECDVKLLRDALNKDFEVKLLGDCQRTLTTPLPPAEPYVVMDESFGASQSANAWYTSLGTRSPQLVAAASAEDAFKVAATTEVTQLSDTTVVCRVSTKRAEAKRKQAMLAVRFSFGGLMAVGASVQARAAGEPLTFAIPNVTLAPQGHVKLAVVDTAADWGGAATTTFDEKPLSFIHDRFDAECRTLGPAQTRALADRSLERLRALPDLPDTAFELDPKNTSRVAARLKLIDGVRDIEALVGRKSEIAKAAQTFADERLKRWAERLQSASEALLARAQPMVTLGELTFEVTKVEPRMQACTVSAIIRVKKKTRVSLEQVLKKLKFLDKNGNSVEPFFLEPDETAAVSPDQPLPVKFDIPAVNKADVCAVALPSGDAPPLIVKVAK